MFTTVDRAAEVDVATGATLTVFSAGNSPKADRVVGEGVVLGNKGMQGVGRFTSNSVPNKVTKMSPCAMLIVRTT